MTSVRLRHLADVNPQSSAFNRLPDDTELTFLPLESVWPDSRLDLSQRRRKGAVATGYTRFQDGDILVPKITPTFEAGRAVLVNGLLDGVGAGSTELHVLRPGPQIYEKFLMYVVHTDSFLKLGKSEMYGVAGQQRLPDTFLRDLEITLPSPEQQRRIADFLDAELVKMDTLSGHLRRFDGDIVEREEALLHGTLDSSASTPGCELPEAWRWVPLAHLTNHLRPIMYGIVLPGPHSPGGVPIVKGGDVAANRLTLDDLNCTTHEIERKYARSRLKGGDLVIAIRGSVGEIARVPAELTGANLTQDAARISINAEVNPLWLESVLTSPIVSHQIQQKVTGATIKGINIWDLKRVLIPTPSRAEQDQLALTISKELTLHESLRQKISRHAILLKERRAALITAAVTGQFDVSTASGRGVGV